MAEILVGPALVTGKTVFFFPVTSCKYSVRSGAEAWHIIIRCKGMRQGKFYSGLSGIQMPVPRYQYPEGFRQSSRLTYYAHHFSSLEVNSCFYKLPRAQTVARWAQEVPNGFVFTFKLLKEITHTPEFTFHAQHVADFFHTIEQVNDKHGCVLVQLPPKLTSNFIFRLDELLSCIDSLPQRSRWHIAVEFRNKSWYNNDVFSILREHNASTVIHDMPKSATPSLYVHTDFVYVRFHGPKGNYDGSYSHEFVSEYATYIHDWMRDGKNVFVYFNNTKGDAFGNLKTLNKILTESN